MNLFETINLYNDINAFNHPEVINQISNYAKMTIVLKNKNAIPEDKQKAETYLKNLSRQEQQIIGTYFPIAQRISKNEKKFNFYSQMTSLPENLKEKDLSKLKFGGNLESIISNETALTNNLNNYQQKINASLKKELLKNKYTRILNPNISNQRLNKIVTSLLEFYKESLNDENSELNQELKKDKEEFINKTKKVIQKAQTIFDKKDKIFNKLRTKFGVNIKPENYAETIQKQLDNYQ